MQSNSGTIQEHTHTMQCNIIQGHSNIIQMQEESQYNTIQYHTIHDNAMQYSRNIIHGHNIQCNTIQYHARHYNTLQIEIHIQAPPPHTPPP